MILKKVKNQNKSPKNQKKSKKAQHHMKNGFIEIVIITMNQIYQKLIPMIIQLGLKSIQQKKP